MKITIFGNPDLEIDNLPIRLLPRLREAFPDVEFEVEDPNNLDLPDIPVGEEWIIMDTVAGIPDVSWLTVEDIAKPMGRLTAHDYDLASYLLLAKKALGPLPIRILGIPMGMSEEAVFQVILKLLIEEVGVNRGISMRVKHLFESVLKKQAIIDEILYLQEKFGITRKQAEDAWLYWDTGIREYSNEIYSSEALRFVMHLHNYLSGSWHEKRQENVLSLLEDIDFQSVCEIGFGVPQKYVHKLMLESEKFITLADFEDTSIAFAQVLLSFWDSRWEERIRLLRFDMNKDTLPGGSEVYIFQDSIEHADDPTKTLKRFVDSVPAGTHFIFSLPVEIENPIPEHHICWKSIQWALDWLKSSGLTVVRHEKIEMNKDVDLFSLSLHPDFSEIVVLAKK